MSSHKVMDYHLCKMSSPEIAFGTNSLECALSRIVVHAHREAKGRNLSGVRIINIHNYVLIFMICSFMCIVGSCST